MRDLTINAKNGIKTAAAYCFIKCACWFKISCIVGSRMAFFSGASIVMPLIGISGLGTAAATTILGLLVRGFISGFNPFWLAVHHIPGFCGALYWAKKSRLIRGIIPLLAIVCFILHPVGRSAYLYSLYWLIPICLQLRKKKSVFLDALGSTFTAHAVGSVLWLYGDPMTPAVWIALIPIVCVERIVCATGMVLVYHLVLYIRNNYHTFEKGASYVCNTLRITVAVPRAFFNTIARKLPV